LESETLAEPASTAVLQADAGGINGATDAGLTPRPAAVHGSVIATIPDDRLFTVSEVTRLLKVSRAVVYCACERGHLQYVKFEGAVQVEGRDLKAWLATCHRAESPTR
jgi:Helix-turn-helix domain